MTGYVLHQATPATDSGPPLFLIAVVVVAGIFLFGMFVRAYRDYSHKRRASL